MRRHEGYRRVFANEVLNTEFEPNTPDNPAAVANWLLYALTGPGTLDVDWLRQLVTPETLEWWGDFRAQAEMLTGCGIIVPVLPAEGDPDVVYVRFPVNPPEGAVRFRDGATVPLTGFLVTLVRRPSLGGWRACYVGAAVPLELVPRD